GDKLSEEGFDCDGHIQELPAGATRPALEVGTSDRPIAAKHRALIRLHYIDGTDKLSWPAIVCCGGRMDVHGAPMPRTWTRLAATANTGATSITLDQPVPGWKVGDMILVTTTQGRSTSSTRRLNPDDEPKGATEEVRITAIDGPTIKFDRALKNDHLGA